MNAEYLLDAVGLLDDDLLREAEEYRRPRRDYRPWLGLAACLAVMLTLGYALTHIRMGGGGAAPGNQMSGGAASAPAGSYGGAEEYPPASAEGPDGSGMQGGGDWPEPSSPDAATPQEPGMAVEADTLAVLIDGGLYRSTGEIIQLSPEEGEVQYGLSWYDEDSGEDRVEPRRWLMLEDGTVAVSWDIQEHGWLVFAPAEE